MGILLLWNEVLDHEKAFNEYLHYVGAGDSARAAEAARTLLKGIEGTLRNIQRDYPSIIIESQMPDFREVAKQIDGPVDSKELAALATKLEKYVTAIEWEVKRHRRKEPPKWLLFLQRSRRAILVGAGCAAGLALLIYGAVRFSQRGQGLTGEYFGDTAHGVYYKTRIDREIDFSWGKGGPFEGWKKDRFSVRWTGYLHVPESGFYDIYVHTDDGARLYLDNHMEIDSWFVQKLRTISLSKNIEEGYHPIRLDYFERGKSATIRLFWKRPGDPRPVRIAGKYLKPAERYLRETIPVHGEADGESDDEADEAEGADGPEDAPRASEAAGK